MEYVFDTHQPGLSAMGEPATYLALHASSTELALVRAGIAAGWYVLAQLGPTPCEDANGCQHLHLIILGTFTQDDLDDVLARLNAHAITTIARLN